jgi:two-component system cell cycle sensor histidine kinase/response regulator CckA
VTSTWWLLLLAAVAYLAAGVVCLGRARRPERRLAWSLAGVGLLGLGITRLIPLTRALPHPLDVSATGPSPFIQLLVAAVLAAGATLVARAWTRTVEEAETARGAAEEQARAEERYRFLVSRLPEAFLILEGGVISYASRVVKHIFGWETNEVVGRRLEELVAEESRQLFNRRYEVDPLSVSLGMNRLELEIVRANGEKRWASMRFQVAVWANRPAETVLISDITPRRRAEMRLEKLTSALIELGPDYADNVNRLTAVCGELLGATCALYNRLQGSLLCSLGTWKAPPDYEAVDDAEGHICRDVIERGPDGGPYVVADLPNTAYARTDPNVARFGLRTYAGFPVTCRGRTVGSLCVVYDEDVTPDEGDVQVLRVVAGAVGIEEERREAAEALREREERYRRLFEATTDGVVFHRRDGRIVDCNATAGEMFSRSREELLSLSLGDLLADADDKHLVGLIAEGFAQRPYFTLAWLKRRDGSTFPAEVSASPVELANETLVVAYLRDVTERLHAEELQAAIYEISEAAQRADNLDELYAAIHTVVSRLMNAKNLYIALYDPVADLVTFPYFVDERDEAPRPRPPARGLTEYILRTGRPLLVSPAVFDALCEEGEVKSIGAASIDWLGVPLVSRDRPIGVLAVQSYTEGVRYGERERDILTFVSRQVALAIERKRSEEALRQSEHKYRTLVDNIEDGVFLLQGPRVVFVNDAFARMVGVEAKAVIGTDFSGFIAPEDREVVMERYRRRQAGEEVPREYELRLLHADGRRRIDVYMHVGIIEYQGAPASLGTLRDLTERKRLEAQLRQAQRIEALGQLAGGVAHDFNNLLMAIMGSAELLQQRAGKGVADSDELSAIIVSTRRASDLTKGLLAFARRQVLEPVLLDLNRHVAQTLPILRRVIPENIGIDFHPAGRVCAIRADRGQVDQILMNLAVNCRDAMPEGGRILIRTADVEVNDAYVADHPWAKVGPHVVLTVSDTGEGMDGETLAHVFEPFFTTKEQGRGTGLGLATVYGIIKQHGGMVDVLSQPGAGTTVDVYFPSEKAELESELVAAATGPPVGGEETILVVEDEEDVRHILVEALKGFGYHVLEAGDGLEALTRMRGCVDPVDLVVSDVVMPRMGGHELLRAARVEGFASHFLFSSGYGEGFLDAGNERLEDVAFIAKPYGIEDLARKVREVLDRPSAATA